MFSKFLHRRLLFFTSKIINTDTGTSPIQSQRHNIRVNLPILNNDDFSVWHRMKIIVVDNRDYNKLSSVLNKIDFIL